jgi:hypothetical protein
MEAKMAETKLHQLAELGQAIWLDYIRRSFITAGKLQAWVDKGLRGVTSNPSIFEKAIAGSTDYDNDLHRLVDEGKTEEEIYEALAIDDIQRAADVLRPVYDETEGADGFVSLEVRPELAHDTAGTIKEARRLFAQVDRPNVMIKVPATPAGIPAIRTLIGEGVNVNITLMFSLAQYDAVAEAYVSGLEARLANGDKLDQIASVASFFVKAVQPLVNGDVRRALNVGDFWGRELPSRKQNHLCPKRHAPHFLLRHALQLFTLLFRRLTRKAHGMETPPMNSSLPVYLPLYGARANLLRFFFGST